MNFDVQYLNGWIGSLQWQCSNPFGEDAEGRSKLQDLQQASFAKASATLSVTGSLPPTYQQQVPHLLACCLTDLQQCLAERNSSSSCACYLQYLSIACLFFCA
jgi:hypothetical protein